MAVLYILGGLFIALLIIIPLIEKSNIRFSEQDMAKYTKFIWPLIGILLLVQLLYLVF